MKTTLTTKIISMFLCLSMLFSFVGCNNFADDDEEDGDIEWLSEKQWKQAFNFKNVSVTVKTKSADADESNKYFVDGGEWYDELWVPLNSDFAPPFSDEFDSFTFDDDAYVCESLTVDGYEFTDVTVIFSGTTLSIVEFESDGVTFKYTFRDYGKTHCDADSDGICDNCEEDCGSTDVKPGACTHVDKNDDGECDKCEEPFTDGCDAHRDSDDDGFCDECGAVFKDGCDNHRDMDDDGRCDVTDCRKSYTDGCDEKDCLDTDNDGLCDNDGCDKPTSNRPCVHIDANDDGKCDKCGTYFEDSCDVHRDSNDDGLCDFCKEAFTDGCDAEHKDANDDGKCDFGGEAFDDGKEDTGVIAAEWAAAFPLTNVTVTVTSIEDGASDIMVVYFVNGAVYVTEGDETSLIPEEGEASYTLMFDFSAKFASFTYADGKYTAAEIVLMEEGDAEFGISVVAKAKNVVITLSADKKAATVAYDLEQTITMSGETITQNGKISAVFSAYGTTVVPEGCEHRDANDDYYCDYCGEYFEDGDDSEDASEHIDKNDDFLCDLCGELFDDGKEPEMLSIPNGYYYAHGDSIDTMVDGEYFYIFEPISNEETVILVAIYRLNSEADSMSLCMIAYAYEGDDPTVKAEVEEINRRLQENGFEIETYGFEFTADGFIIDGEYIYSTKEPDCYHRDADDDYCCDHCGEPCDDGCDNHVDANDDYYCDKCGEYFVDGDCYHRDADDDWSCDYCGEYFEDAHDVCYDYDDDGVCDYSSWNDDWTVETPCGKPCDDGCDNMIDADDNGECDFCEEAFEDGCDNHVDANADGKCDVADCGIDMPGTELNPIQVEIEVDADYNPTGFTVVVPAGASLYYVAYNIGGMNVTINANVTIVAGGNKYTPDAEGVITFVAEGNGRMPVNFAITNDGAEDVTVEASLAYPEGSMNNPLDLELGDVSVDVAEGNNQGVYYSWTANGNGVLTVAVKGNLTEGGAFDIQISNSNSYAVLNFMDATYNEADDVTVITMEVTKGDVVVFTFASMPDAEWNIPAVTIDATVEFVCAHVDANDNGKCDFCDEEFEDGCDNHRDADDNLACDNCWTYYDDGPEMVYCDHRDADDDYLCDKCGNYYRDACDFHIDADDNLRCDKCNAAFDDGQDLEDIPETPDRTDKFDYISWGITEVVMQLNLNSSGNELQALTKRYMAGEDGEGERIDDYVMDRNDAACDTTAVYPTYIYLEETDGISWGKYNNEIAIDIATFVQGETPDMYCGFAYDLTMAATLGYFKNLYNDGGENGNHFTFLLDDYRPQYDDEGYLIDFMKSTTPLPETRMYLYASNYTIDVIRSMYVIPVSISLLGLMDLDDLPDGSDRNDDGVYEITEFYDMVRDIQWTYDMMAKLSAAIFSPVAGTSSNSLNNINGFVLDTGMGLPTAGMTYSVDFYWADQIIDEDGNYSYVVPKANANLEQMAIAYENLFKADGIFMSTRTMESQDVGTSVAGMGIRQRFSEDMILFGNVVLVGQLDYEQYQNMEFGFGIAPIPLYATYEGAEYRTAIHNIARVIGISKESAYFSEITAFLDYQALNSDQVMNQYYRSLQYETVGGEDYNIEMLDYLRSNIRSNRDQYLENICNNKGVGIIDSVSGLGDYKWSSFFRNSSFQAATIRAKYEEASPLKNQALAKLVEMYENLDPEMSCNGHRDANDDYRCDNCREYYVDGCDIHRDANDDYRCDYCWEYYEDGCDHRDADDNYYCDYCGEYCYDGCDNHRDADDDLKCDKCWTYYDDGPEASTCEHRDADDDYICDKCGMGYRDACDIHIDADDNLKCDKCNRAYDDGQDSWDIPETPDRTDKFDDISWDVTEVIMQLNLNSAGNELQALTKRYMAGEDGEGERIDDYVMDRNDAAYDTTAVYPTYIYLEETDRVGWNAYTNRIATDIATFVQGETSDMYCGFAYDLSMSATLGYFKNLYNDGGEKGNHFTFLLDDYKPQYDDEGYLIDFMKSVTPLPETKMYLYASNYTIDVIRSMYVIPVSMSLLGQIDVSDLPDGSDRNDDGVYEITEFYDMVRDVEWTYDMMAKLSAAIFSPVAGTSSNSLNNVNGFVLDTGMGLPSAGMTYSVDFYWADQIIDEDGNYSYVVPKANANLEQMAVAYENLFKADGIFMSNANMESNDVGTSGAGMGIRQRFSEDMILFGGVVVVGALDYEQYQNMECGFGIAPIPLYATYEGAEYRTAIHNLARVIGISKESAYFSEITAFLDYQALNSDRVLTQYYRSLQYETVGGEDYNIEMLDYLRSNIRSNRDQYLENICNNSGVGILSSVAGLGDYKWGYFFRNTSFQAATIRGKYEEASSLKNQALAKLVELYEALA